MASNLCDSMALNNGETVYSFDKAIFEFMLAGKVHFSHQLSTTMKKKIFFLPLEVDGDQYVD